MRLLRWKTCISWKIWNFLNSVKSSAQKVKIESIVIPCVGANYVEEAVLAGNFAHRSFEGKVEILIVSDQPESAFSGLSAGVKTRQIPLAQSTRTTYQQIWQSRLVKLQAPLLAQGKGILMIDSDLMLLKPFQFDMEPGALFGVFRKGMAFSRVKQHKTLLPEITWRSRIHEQTHLNGAFLFAHRETWEKLCPLWTQLYKDIWSRMPENEAPRDQLPLTIAMDRLGLWGIDVGTDYNWPVSKKWSTQPMQVPDYVIGAHGGFPIQEWHKYWASPKAELTFVDQKVSREIRYKA